MGRKRRRTGATTSFSVSTDEATKAALKELADERHAGNVSELITELAREAVRNAAADRLWTWGGAAEMTPKERAAFWKEVESGWKAAREKPKRSRRRAA
jgi:hypothetical protein